MADAWMDRLSEYLDGELSGPENAEMERRLTARDAIFDPVPDSRDDDRAFSPAAYLPSANADPATLV